MHVVEWWSAACGKEDAFVGWLQSGCGVWPRQGRIRPRTNRLLLITQVMSQS